VQMTAKTILYQSCNVNLSFGCYHSVKLLATKPLSGDFQHTTNTIILNASKQNKKIWGVSVILANACQDLTFVIKTDNTLAIFFQATLSQVWKSVLYFLLCVYNFGFTSQVHNSGERTELSWTHIYNMIQYLFVK